MCVCCARLHALQEHTAKLNKTMEQIMALTVRLSQKPHSWPPVAPGMNICDAVCMAVRSYVH